MKKMIVNGEEWMLPLLEFRDWLRDLRNDENSRDIRRRNGQKGIGPFTMGTRQRILENLLKMEEEIGQTLISTQELVAIQYQWNYDGNFRESVSRIFNRIKGGNLVIPDNDADDRRREEYEILEEVCEEKNVNPEHIKELLEVERSKLSFLRRRGMFEDLKTKIAGFVSRNEDII